MSEKLHTALIEAAKDMRDQFDARDLSSMTLEVEVSGRVHGELKIEYRVRGEYDARVEGATLDACIEEYFRRKGWNTRNAPVMLAAPTMEPVTVDEE